MNMANIMDTIAKLNCTLKNLDNAFDDEIFRLLELRINTTQKSKDLLQVQLDRHYDALVHFADNIKLETPDTSIMDEVCQLLRDYSSAVEELQKLSQSNFESKAALDDSRSCLQERIQAIKNLVGC